MPPKKPTLSICIPTYNRSSILKKTLENLTSEYDFINSDKIEIVVSDNQSNDDTESVVFFFMQKFKGKIIYSKNNQNLHDANFEKSLSLGNGEFLKLHNDSLLVRPGTFTEILKIIDACIIEKPLIFFLNGKSKSIDPITICESANCFLKHVSYNCTWIGGFGIWKNHLSNFTDFSRYAELKLTQTDALFRMLSSGQRAIILNEFYFPLQDIGPRGGYSISKVFGKNYIKILKENVQSNNISDECFNHEKKIVLLEHIIPYHFNTSHNFKEYGFYEHLDDYYNESYFIEIINNKIKTAPIIEEDRPNTNKSSIATIWRSLNPHNETFIIKDFNYTKTTVGNYTYGALDVATFNAEEESLSIGSFVSIAEGVKFILGGNHFYEGFSTFPFAVKFLGHASEALTKGPIIISDDVWIGYGSIILSGITVGQGAIIAAGSVLTKNVPPYAIAGGNPARIIKYRFSESVIKKLIKIDFSKINIDNIQKNSERLYLRLNEKNIDEFIKNLTEKK